MKYIPLAAGTSMVVAVLVCVFPVLRLPFFLGAAALAIVSLIAWFVFGKELAFRLCVHSCFFLLGAMLFLPGQIDAERTARDFDRVRVHCRAVILEDPTVTSSGRYVALAESDDAGFSQKFLLYAREKWEILDVVEGDITFYAPSEDSRMYYAGLDAALSASSGYLTFVEKAHRPVQQAFVSLRRFVRNSLLRYTDTDGFGLSYALLTGNTGDMGASAVETMRRAGLSHMVAVSGMHVAILLSFAAPFLARVRSRRLRVAANFLAMGFLWVLAGGTPSVSRAVVMSGVAALQPGLRRGSLPLNRLGIAVCVLVLLSPNAPLTLSFQLSFLATWGILLFAKPLFSWMVTGIFLHCNHIAGPVLRTVLQGVSLSCAAFLWTYPVLLLQMGQVNLAGIFATVVCSPVAAGIFVCALCTVLCAVFPFLPLAKAFGWLCCRGCEGLFFLAEKMAALPFYGLVDSSRVRWATVGAVAVGFAVTLFSAQRKRARNVPPGRRVALLFLFVAALSATCFVGTLLPDNPEAPGKDQVLTAFLDVGQGSCFVAIHQDSALVFDCGGTLSPGRTAAEYLTAHGAKRVETLFLSHLHDDHANGVLTLAQALPVEEIVVPFTPGDGEISRQLEALCQEKEIPLTVLTEDLQREFFGNEIRILTQHLDPAAADENENCAVGLWEFATDRGRLRFLLTGDLTLRGEIRLAEWYGDELACDVLAVPHHGSGNACGVTLLDLARPQIAVISVGKNNTYGHPDTDTLARLEGVCRQVFRTDTDGTVEILFEGAKAQVFRRAA